MKFSEAWLREWIDPPFATAELSARLTMAGLEVDGQSAAAPALSGVVVAEIIAVQPHPNADRLRLCRVNAGERGELEVVCGAPNVRVGLRVPLVLAGARLPDGSEIVATTVRGVHSAGMLAAASELGLDLAGEGLLELDAQAPLGAALSDVLQLDDQIIEIGLTPNRGDCLGIAGLAREVGVLARQAVCAPAERTVPALSERVIPVRVEAPEACPRYLGRVIENIQPDCKTPLWLRERLRRSGVRSISPVVDVTNYVMLELGQPLHAFDLEKIQGGIQVRMARAGESITLLDGQQLQLDQEVLLIADAVKPLAMAGIMGGADSGVTATTRHLFIESAFFAPLAIAGRARRHGLHTDASHRYERGVDFELPRRALERATALLTGIVGGVPGPIIEQVQPELLPKPAVIALRASRINRLLGMEMAPTEVEDLLGRLGCRIESEAAGQWCVTVPSFRFDLNIEVDLIEELARLHGYDRLPTRVPLMPLQPGAGSERTLSLREFRRRLTARGYQEAITYSFVDPELNRLIDPAHEALPLANPMSKEMAVMRGSLWPGLLLALRGNLNRQQSRVRLFESGLRFVQQGDQLLQEPMLAGVIAGSRHPESWGITSSEMVDFFDLKGDIETLFALTGARHQLELQPAHHPALHPGQSAQLVRDGKVLGQMGQLHPTLVDSFDLKSVPYLFELNLNLALENHLEAYRSWSHYPSVRRDLAFLVDRELPFRMLEQAIKAAAGPDLSQLILFDLYQGKGIDPKRKSMALGLIFQSQSHTLGEAEIQSSLDAVIRALEQRFQAEMRR
ncbi:MAG TPA: phenylalanine--tRNA ligase subunit beta [Pseudomonadales bacterium]|jgi:phenylalanyl-tRNA synthetase beta chain|nr:phenylalanine--tRNA ligase subunit beta [Pseudomonadales bacterium]HMW15415.1 phenylalanine--tRNA ligase subunit beta [Pseudomonadales bacterium]HMW83513.1 phenylalanine--tRNA ligase subunit beta [Pseudomonadales bacterium]HMZ71156.1 phenylalanine--tRNA ligase subunit beta [Pseudomonadales bacterium]HMZ91824.1 phenylalanine--tRNA ligase subunit beta [Pseudomonadales bacterium]